MGVLSLTAAQACLLVGRGLTLDTRRDALGAGGQGRSLCRGEGEQIGVPYRGDGSL